MKHKHNDLLPEALPKSSRWRSRISNIIGIINIVLVVLGVAYFGIEKAIVAKMRSNLDSIYGDNYAILALHMGGKNFSKPSLWQMLTLIHEYNFTDGYEPQGSGHFTGKQYYLTILISNNEVISDCNWSFRMFKLDFGYFDPYANVADVKIPWDIIDNLPDSTASFYRFKESGRVKRNGMWFVDEYFNSESISFYHRAVAN